MAQHLLPTEILSDYASGAASPGVALLVSAHMTHAPQARRAVADIETCFGAILSDTQPTDMRDGALDEIFSRIDGGEVEAQTAESASSDTGPLPAPVLEAVGCDFDDIPWKFRMPGVSVHDLDGYGAEGEKVQLLRARPGVSVPQHTHNGTEMTLILQGTLLDQGIAYHPGDIALNDEDDDHQPRVIGHETCYCLIVQHGDLKFTGKFSRILNLLGE